jgi:hypothetical protein
LSDRLLKSTYPKGGIDTITESRMVSIGQKDQVSCRTTVQWWLRNLDNSHSIQLFKREPVAIWPLLGVIQVTNSSFLEEVRFHSARIFNKQYDNVFNPTPKKCVEILRRLYKNLGNHIAHLRQNLYIIQARQHRDNRHTDSDDGPARDTRRDDRRASSDDELTRDIEYLMGEMKAWQERVVEDMKFMGSEQSVKQAELVNVLTTVGMLFFPINAAAAALAISDSWFRLCIWAVISIVSFLATGWYWWRRRRNGFENWSREEEDEGSV